MLRIITDFDGPIMDVSERYYRVYLFCLEEIRNPDQPVQCLSKAEFWQLKRSQVPEREIGQLSGLTEPQSIAFAKLRWQTVHTAPYLVYDRPVPGALETLQRIQQQGIDLIVLTMRRAHELNHVLKCHRLEAFFPPHRRYCLEDDYDKGTDVYDKTLLMKRMLTELPPASETWMIGDTEADVLSAQEHGIRVIAVLSGIRNQDRLLQHQPDWIVNTLADAVEIILHSAPLP